MADARQLQPAAPVGRRAKVQCSARPWPTGSRRPTVGQISLLDGTTGRSRCKRRFPARFWPGSNGDGAQKPEARPGARRGARSRPKARRQLAVTYPFPPYPRPGAATSGLVTGEAPVTPRLVGRLQAGAGGSGLRQLGHFGHLDRRPGLTGAGVSVHHSAGRRLLDDFLGHRRNPRAPLNA